MTSLQCKGPLNCQCGVVRLDSVVYQPACCRSVVVSWSYDRQPVRTVGSIGKSSSGTLWCLFRYGVGSLRVGSVDWFMDNGWVRGCGEVSGLGNEDWENFCASPSKRILWPWIFANACPTIAIFPIGNLAIFCTKPTVSANLCRSSELRRGILLFRVIIVIDLHTAGSSVDRHVYSVL